MHSCSRTCRKNCSVVGGGIIGLEMACVYDALGAKVTVVELLDQLMPGSDPDLVRPLAQRLNKRYAGIHLKVKVAKVEATKEGLKGQRSKAEKGARAADLRPRARRCRPLAERQEDRRRQGRCAGHDRGFIPVDKQMRTNVPHIFAIGDIVGNPMLAHKATHEGKVAAEVCAGHKSEFVARVIPSVAYTDPEVAWVGVTEVEAKKDGIKFGVGKVPLRRVGPRDRHRPHRGLHQADLRRGDAPRDRRRHRRPERRRPDLRSRARDRDGLRGGRHRPDRAPASRPCRNRSAWPAEVYEGTITDLYIPKKK
jgi:dihydrolipoamide dehydrogenase